MEEQGATAAEITRNVHGASKGVLNITKSIDKVAKGAISGENNAKDADLAAVKMTKLGGSLLQLVDNAKR